MSFSHSATALLAFAIAAAALLFVEYATWRLFFAERRATAFGPADAKLFAKTVLISLAVSVAFEAMTLFGSAASGVLVLSDWSVVRLVAFFGLAYVGCLLALFRLRVHPCSLIGRLKDFVVSARFAREVVAALAVVVCSCVVGALMSEAMSLSFSFLTPFLVALFGSAIYGIVWFKSAKRRPERLFLTVALLFGSCMAFLLPAETHISWDDQVHYRQALALSYVYGSEYADADAVLLNPLIEDDGLGRPGVGGLVAEQDVSAYHDRLDNLYAEGGHYKVEGFATAVPDSSLASYSTIGYVPSAIGLWTGRLLHLPYHLVFMLGRWFNLIAYVAVVYLAIRIIPIKKMLMCAIALLPTALFMASSYSYDPWLISFCMLAVALVVKELCEPGLRMTRQRWALLLALFFIALGPKAVYFPLIGLLFLLPAEKFSSRRSRRRCFASAAGLALLVVATFAVPLLTSGGSSSGDPRGGSGVDAVGQMLFILRDPMGYASILGHFLVSSYLTIFASDGYATFFAYAGGLNTYVSYMAGVPVVVVMLIAVTESNRVSSTLSRPSVVLWTAFVVLASVVLIATSMYVSFTPVGLDTVNGCQQRYLLPLLFAFFALCFNVKSEFLGSSRFYQVGAFAVASLPLVLCCWYLVASRVLA